MSLVDRLSLGSLRQFDRQARPLHLLLIRYFVWILLMLRCDLAKGIQTLRCPIRIDLQFAYRKLVQQALRDQTIDCLTLRQ